MAGDARNTPDVRTYVAECFYVGVKQSDLVALGDRAGRAADELTEEGRRVVFLGSILVPEDEIVLIQFAASSAHDAADAATRAGIPFDRVVESVNTAAPASDLRKE
jgi:hypothetical protein